MKKAQLPQQAELDPVADTNSTSTNASNECAFQGTSNPRHIRVLRALLTRGKLAREDVDRIGGTSNGPQLIAELRHLGLEVPCTRVAAIDRDGCMVYPGVYSLSQRDRREVIKALFG